MRPAQDLMSGHSPTPIYDALYSEYRRSFRALPGDRSGEDDFGFRGFAAVGHSGSLGFRGAHQHHHPTRAQAPHPQTAPGFQPYPAHGGTHWQLGGAANGVTGHMQGRQHTGLQPLPAALPPGPRRGL
ncbi:hypothetical protein [Streptomyces sp. YS-3]|uniref:hypothetical protein n=1 Tax=Streptomyces sp. YS-3 TaxID=3381352 RepID=UPI003862C5AF